MQKQQNSDRIVAFRVSEKEWEELVVLAKSEGVSVNEYARTRTFDSSPATLNQLMIEVGKLSDDYDFNQFYFEMLMNFLQQSYIDTMARLRTLQDGSDYKSAHALEKGKLDDIMLRCAKQAIRFRVTADQKYDPFWSQQISDAIAKNDDAGSGDGGGEI